MIFHDKRETKTRLVPWFNMAEWDQVYKQIYSDDTVAQVKGFERLLLWKARCPQGIPAGAQCTLDLIQICLKDREVWPQIENGLLPPYHEHDLQLMYSMAVLRFLNHLAGLVKTKNESLYQMAAKMHIPDWVVNIRHDTSHDHNLPSISLLREATHFCLQWIHENYWKNEAEMTSDWIVSSESTDYAHMTRRLKHIVEMWQAVMLYSSMGFETYSEIPDSELRQHLLDERTKYSEEKMKIMMKKIKSEGHFKDENEMTEAQFLIRKEVEECIKENRKFGDEYKILVDVLLQGDGFLASPDFLSVFSISDNLQKFPQDFLNMWQVMLNCFQQGKILPQLIKKLIQVTSSENESCHRRKVAALWVKELTQSLNKYRKTRKLARSWKRNIPNSKVARRVMLLKTSQRTKLRASTYIRKQVLRAVERKNPQLKHVMALHVQRLPPSLTKMKLLREIVLKPSKWTNIFLPYLMDLMDPPLPKETREKLLTLIKIYTRELRIQDDENIDPNYQVHTVHNLTREPDTSENCHEEQMDCSSTALNSHWFRNSEKADWGKCPLGLLPWQNNGSMLQLDLPCDTVWQPSQQVITYTDGSLPGFFHTVINWDKVFSKRPTQKKIFQEMQDTNIVEKAFDAVLNQD
ncbi:ribosomal biogenesis protein LAS1L [Periplaneta americana]|uniref:ribosomal biogenesis protein LAS1L n=1 Tax=Periplaneta americana TaxID=6978 RepID=UPI0037E7B9E6